MDLYLPAFPQLADDLGASEAAVQLTLTADVIGLVVGQLVLGPLSDARGRRGLLIGSTLVCAIASALCALAPSAAVLSGWRVLAGAARGGGGGAPPPRAAARGGGGGGGGRGGCCGWGGWGGGRRGGGGWGPPGRRGPGGGGGPPPPACSPCS